MLDKQYSNILFSSSFFMLILSVFLYYLDFKIVSLLYFILFMTSINHWKNPDYNIKRLIDIYMVMITTVVSLVYAPSLELDLDYFMYNITAFYTLLLFIVSNLFFIQKDYLISTLLHSKIHLICLVGNCMMFYGLFTAAQHSVTSTSLLSHK